MQTATEMRMKPYAFPVSLEQAFDKRGREVPKTRLVVRQDTDAILATVSDRYNLVPYAGVMDKVDGFVKNLGKADARYYVERGGGRLIATHTFKDLNFKLPGHKMNGQREVGDVVALKIHSINSYNRNTSLEVKLGAMVLRCLNGMTVMDDLFNLRFRHTGMIELKFPNPELVVAAFEKQGAIWERWADRTLEPGQMKQLIEDGSKMGLVTQKTLKENEAYFHGAETVWDAMNAFTYGISHVSKLQESGRITRLDRLNALFNHTFENKVA